MPDLSVENHGSIFLLRGNTDAGREWISEHIVSALTWCGAIVVEHRFIDDIVVGASEDGLEVA